MTRFELREYDDYGYVGVSKTQPFPESYSLDTSNYPYKHWYVDFNTFDELMAYMKKHGLHIGVDVDYEDYLLDYTKEASQKAMGESGTLP